MWISVEIQSAEIYPKAYREEVFLIVSLKTLFENLNLVISYDITNPTVFVFSLRENTSGASLLLNSRVCNEL